MYYRLKDEYILRGWENLPYAVADTRTGESEFLTPQQMQALELCDGEIDVSDIFIPETLKEFIAEAAEKGTIEQCKRGEGLKDFQKYRKYPNRYIRHAHWLITGKCNYKCRHCFISAPDVNAYEAPHGDIMKIIDMLAECGVMQVKLTGGEALTRKDFWEIVDALLERGITITKIYSNGALVTENVLKELEKRKIRPGFNISFDGVDGWHDWLRGVEGAQKLTDRAFALCRDRGFYTSATMSVHQGNKHTLRDTINHLASLGVKGIKAVYIADLGEWKTHSDNDDSFGFKDIFQTYLDYLPYYYGEDNMPMNIFLTSFFAAVKNKPDQYKIISYNEEYDPKETFLCPSSRNSVRISQEGRVLMCGMMIEMNIVKLFPAMPETHLRDCINFPEHLRLCNMTAEDFLKANEECRTCKFTKHCYGGCRGPALMEGNLMGTVKSVCEMYKGGWIKKIVETVKKCRPTAECPVKDLSLL